MTVLKELLVHGHDTASDDNTYGRARKSPNTSRSRRSRSRAGARCVETLSLIQSSIAADRSAVAGGIDEAARAANFLDPWLGCGRGLCDDGGHHGFDKHAISHGTVEITLTLNAAIVFASLVLKLDPYPLSDLEACLARKPNGGFTAIVELHGLARLKIRHYENRRTVGASWRRLRPVLLLKLMLC